MYSVDIYNRVPRACLKDGMSAREAARYFNRDRKTIAKMLRHELPPGYQRSEPPRRPTLDGFVGVIDEVLRAAKALIKKQRLTAKRIFERWRYRYVQSDRGIDDTYPGRAASEISSPRLKQPGGCEHPSNEDCDSLYLGR